MENVFVNKQWVIQARDIAKSWWMFVGVPVVSLLIQWLQSLKTDLPIKMDWNDLLIDTAVATGLFLLQRSAAKPSVITTQPDNQTAEIIADTIKQKQL